MPTAICGYNLNVNKWEEVPLSTPWPCGPPNLFILGYLAYHMCDIWLVDWNLECLEGLTVPEIITITFKDLYIVISTYFSNSPPQSSSHLCGPFIQTMLEYSLISKCTVLYSMFSKTLVQQLYWECPDFPSLAKFLFISQAPVLTSLEILPSQLPFLVWLKFVASLSNGSLYIPLVWHSYHIIMVFFFNLILDCAMPQGYYILSLSHFPIVVGIFTSDNNTCFSLGNGSFSMCVVLTIIGFLFPWWQDWWTNHCTLMPRP